MNEPLVIIARAVVAMAVMASASYVIGTVVGYQYLSLILGLKGGVDRTFRRLVRRWYTAALPTGVVFCFVFDHLRSTPRYSLMLAGFVLVCWCGWWIHAHRALREKISRRRVGWEFFATCFSLGVVSAIIGLELVGQVFIKLFEWKI